MSEENVSLVPKTTHKLNLVGRRIPKSSFAELKDVSQVLADARALLAQAEADIEQAKTQAYDDAWLLVYEESISQMAFHIAEAKSVSHELYDNAGHRIIEIAVAMLKRIAPSLPVDNLVADLLMNALKELRADRFLSITVHPKALLTVKEKLEVWRQSLGYSLMVEYHDNEELPLFACIVESDHGVVHAGFEEQLQVIEHTLKEHNQIV